MVSAMSYSSVTKKMTYNMVLIKKFEFVYDKYAHVDSKLEFYIAVPPSALLFIDYSLLEESCCRVHAVGYRIASYCGTRSKRRWSICMWFPCDNCQLIRVTESMEQTAP